ncbi:ubiquinol-cytochrome C reductase complex 14kD subunit domain-containing protein [Phthorimaea operculella]|nr:ubiquinol-cytochrome C reductase complex 14kD subunit domain-containing protein [Phthorimaea operculella]
MAFRLTSRLLFRVTPVSKNNSINKWAYNMAGFNRYGLMRDDCLYETEDVLEAIRRLPASVRDERVFRQIRAIQASGTKTYLPKAQWTRYEDDVLYLSPIVDQVRMEREERENWEKEF